MKRVLILGRGGSGKSTLAAKLGEITGLPVIELDKLFWQRGLEPIHRAEWVKTQRRLVEREQWIMDGDLGQYDAVEVRFSPPIPSSCSTSCCYGAHGKRCGERASASIFGDGWSHIESKAFLC